MGKRSCINVSCMKTAFNVCASILWILAGGIFGVGLYILIVKNHYESLLGSMTYITCVGLMIGGGVFAMFVCIFGIIGSIQESKFMVLGFTLMISVVCALELAGGVMAFLYKDDLAASVGGSLNVTIQTQYGLPGQGKKTNAVDRLQRTYECCGDVEFKSWDNSEWKKSNITTLKVPNSCCILPANDNCGARDHPSNIWRNDRNPLGCFPALKNYLHEMLKIIGLVCVCVGLSQVVSIGMSIKLYRMLVEFR